MNIDKIVKEKNIKVTRIKPNTWVNTLYRFVPAGFLGTSNFKKALKIRQQQIEQNSKEN